MLSHRPAGGLPAIGTPTGISGWMGFQAGQLADSRTKSGISRDFLDIFGYHGRLERVLEFLLVQVRTLLNGLILAPSIGFRVGLNRLIVS